MLIKQLGIQQFHIAELGSREIFLAHGVVAAVDDGAQFSWNVVVQPVLSFFLLGGLFLVSGGQLRQVLHTNIIRCTAQVVGIHQSEAL